MFKKFNINLLIPIFLIILLLGMNVLVLAEEEVEVSFEADIVEDFTLIEESGFISINEDPSVAVYLPENWKYSEGEISFQTFNEIDFKQIFTSRSEINGESFLVNIAFDQKEKFEEYISNKLFPVDENEVIYTEEGMKKGEIDVIDVSDEGGGYEIIIYYLHNDSILEFSWGTPKEDRKLELKDMVVETMTELDAEFPVEDFNKLF